MPLYIRNRLISEPIYSILCVLQRELTNGKLRDIKDKKSNVLVTCPVHKDGHELHPSCSVYAEDSEGLPYGTAHCFTCGYVASLPQFISDCLDESDVTVGEDWLIERFGDLVSSKQLVLPDLDLYSVKTQNRSLDPSILSKFNYKHPYLINRGISQEILDFFHVGFDIQNQAVTFPVWDEKGNLVMITSRSVNSKNFYIPESTTKPVYLYNYIKKYNITDVYVAESQINTLQLYTWGYSAIGLMGTGSEEQYSILKRSGIRSYHLALDGDQAGYKGIYRFIKNLSSDVLIDVVVLPPGKDVNDIDKLTFDSLPRLDDQEWLQRNRRIVE